MSGLRTTSSAILGTLFAVAIILADPNREQLSGVGQSWPQGGEQYVYTLNGPGYDCNNSNRVNSMPILKAYIKWIAENDNLKSGTPFPMDGQYTYRYNARGRSITRINLRTGEESGLVELSAVVGSVTNIWMEGGMLFLGGNISNAQGNSQGILYAVSITEKKVKWTFTPPQAYRARNVLVVPDDMIMVQDVKISSDKKTLGGDRDELYCLKRTNGEVLWKQPDSSISTVLCGDALICAAQKEIYARSLKDGSVIWRTPYKDFIYSNGGIFSDNQRVFVIQMGPDYNLIAFDGATGKEIWRKSGIIGRSLDGKGHILVAEYDQKKLMGSALLLDPATGETATKLPVNLMATQVLGDWAYANDFGFTKGPPAQILGVILSFNVETGKSNILLDGREKDAPINPHGIGSAAAIDGYLLVSPSLRSGKSGWVCLEDMRFHPDAAKMLFDLRPEMLDEKMKTRIAKLIKELDADNYDTRSAAEKELISLADFPEEQVKTALKGEPSQEVRAVCENLLKSIEKYYKELRKYLDELGCRKDPIYFTALIRHTADLAIQEKAIDRLKKITGQDFGLKPSAEWIKDQKEASDKYDDWWPKNRDKLTWSDKEDRYISRLP